MHDLTLWSVLLLAIAAGAAGWVDAVSGGGGLLQLPALFIALPAGSEVNALATNKFSSFFGTATAARTYVKHLSPDWKTALPMASVAFAFSAMGAATAHIIPTQYFGIGILVALVLVWLWTLLNPLMGTVSNIRWGGTRKHYVAAIGVGSAIGFYDGILGPGTGSFLLIALVSLLGYSFLAASSTAKIVNLGTNAAALLVFGFSDSILWILGLVMAVCNMGGAFFGFSLRYRITSQLTNHNWKSR
jgi:uncharacterized membrane protein YfcA